MVKNLIKTPLTRTDAWIACFIVCLITFHPYFLHQRINLFELGLYLPGINAILDGQIPYRDFFYLRAPMDLYLPALLMKVFGTNAAVLSAYFYVGTVITLCACVLIAREIIPSRLLFYTFVPVLVTRTFPRVVFTYWGGMRYGWGLLAVWCLIRFLKSKHRGWLIAMTALTVIAGLTSIEIGVCLGVAITVVLAWANRRALMVFWIMLFAFLLPYNYYLGMNGAWFEYMNTQLVVAREMLHTFPQTEPVPSSIGQVLHALFVPINKNFRQMTPVYCYLIFVGYLIWRWRKKQLDWVDQAAAAVAVYGFMVYVTGFRNLWASVFEMSLQPQKVLLFYLLARAVESLMIYRKKIAVVFLAIIVISSLIFSVERINKRFLFFRKSPLKGQETVVLDIPRLKGLVVPKDQAEDIHGINDFVNQHVAPHEPMLMYPEMGAMHFIVNRPWVGRFALVTSSWFSPDWHNGWMKALKEKPPQYTVCLKQVPDYFHTVHFKVESNRKYYQDAMQFIQEHYHVVAQTPSYNIMKLNVN